MLLLLGFNDWGYLLLLAIFLSSSLSSGIQLILQLAPNLQLKNVKNIIIFIRFLGIHSTLFSFICLRNLSFSSSYCAVNSDTFPNISSREGIFTPSFRSDNEKSSNVLFIKFLFNYFYLLSMFHSCISFPMFIFSCLFVFIFFI